MQTASGWCSDPLVSLRPGQTRARQSAGGLGPRRESLDLQGRPSLELPALERALSCSALPEPRRTRAQLQRTSAKRGQINAAGAVAVCELQQEAAAPSLPDLDSYDLPAHKQEVEEVRLRLEQYWNEPQVCTAWWPSASRVPIVELFQPVKVLQEDSVPQQTAESPHTQRTLLEAKWQGHQQVPTEQKRQNAASRSTSSRRARRRVQPLAGLPAQRVRLQQSLGPSRAIRRSAPTKGPDEQLLDRLRSQLVSSRSGAQVAGFLDSLGRTPVLTKQQESGLTHIIRRGILLEQKHSALEDELGRMPTEEELRESTGCSPEVYARRVRLSAEGKVLMMRYNLRLVYSIAKQFQNRGLEMDDMLPEGVVGLEKAIEKFEPEKGFRFSTYSHWWIRQHIHRALVESRIIRLPVNVVDNIARVGNARRKLGEKPGRSRPVSDEEIANALGLPLAKVKHLVQLSQPIRSLDTPLFPDEEGAQLLHERVAAKEGPTSEEEVVGEQAQDLVENDMTALLQTLPLRERNVIRWRYGLSADGKSLGLQEVGAAYGLTQERIRQIEESGLAHLRERSPAHFKDWLPGL